MTSERWAAEIACADGTTRIVPLTLSVEPHCFMGSHDPCEGCDCICHAPEHPQPEHVYGISTPSTAASPQ